MNMPTMSFAPRAAVAALAAALVAPLSSQPLGAQTPATFPAPNAALERFWRLGMDSSQVQRLGQVLLDSLGPRLSGTARQKAANDWLVSLYKQWGAEGKNEQVGTWRGWRRGHSHIDLVSPRVRTLEGTMLAWSPGTKSEECDGHHRRPATLRRQHRVRTVVAAGEGQIRARVGAAAHLPAHRELDRERHAGEQGAPRQHARRTAA
jgi:hypothetical protein